MAFAAERPSGGSREAFGVPASAGFICIGRLKAGLQTDPAPGAHFQVRLHAARGATTHENGGSRTIPEDFSSVTSVLSVAVVSVLSAAIFRSVTAAEGPVPRAAMSPAANGRGPASAATLRNHAGACPKSGETMRNLRMIWEPRPRASAAFVRTCFTESLRVPVTPENRRLLREVRAAELRLWEEARTVADERRAVVFELSPLRL